MSVTGVDDHPLGFAAGDRTAVTTGAVLSILSVTLADVVKVTVHLADLARDFAGFNAAYQRIVPAPYPVRTTVGSTLAGFLVEIDVVAAAERDD